MKEISIYDIGKRAGGNYGEEGNPGPGDDSGS